MYFYLRKSIKEFWRLYRHTRQYFLLGLSQKEMFFERFSSISFLSFFQLFLSPLIYMARAIFSTYPETSKKWWFLKFDKVKKKSDLWLFLAVNTLDTFNSHDLKNRLLKITGSSRKWTLKVRKNRFFSEKCDNNWHWFATYLCFTVQLYWRLLIIPMKFGNSKYHIRQMPSVYSSAATFSACFFEL